MTDWGRALSWFYRWGCIAYFSWWRDLFACFMIADDSAASSNLKIDLYCGKCRGSLLIICIVQIKNGSNIWSSQICSKTDWYNIWHSQIHTAVAWCSFLVKFWTVSLEFRAGPSFCIFSFNEKMQPKAADENQKKEIR